MWIIDGIYLVIALLLGSAMLWTQELWLAIIPLCALLTLECNRLYGKYVPAWLTPSLLILLSSLLILLADRQASLVLRLPLALAAAIGLLGGGILWRGRHQAALYAGSLSLVTILWMLATRNDPLQALGATRIILWLLISWPLLLFMGRPRWLLMLALVNPLLLLLLSRTLLLHAGAHPATLMQVLTSLPEMMQQGSVLVLLGLILVVAIPLSLEVDFRWRVIAILGAGMFVSSLFMAWTFDLSAALWYSWPVELLLSLVFASLLLGLGIAGIIGSVHRPGLLAGLALRIIALAGMASAVALAPHLGQVIPAEHLVATLAQALAPMAAGVALAVLLGIAAVVAKEMHVPRFNTQRMRRDWARARQRLSSSMLTLAGDLEHSLQRDVRHLADPWRLLPLSVFAAAWPAIFALREGLWVLVLYFVAYISASLVERQMFLWVFIHTLLIALASFSMGYSLAILPLFCSLALLLAWPFCRWPHIDSAFAYPASILLLLPLWLAYPMVDPSQIVLAGTLCVLLANALRRGPIRWLLLAVSGLVCLLWLRTWILQRDPFTTIILEERGVGEEMLRILATVPLMLSFLMLLWLGRLRGRDWWYSLSLPELLSAGWIFTLLIVWAFALRYWWGSGLLALPGLIILAGSIHRHLSMARPASYRHPLTSMFALGLVILLLTLAQALRLLPSDALLAPSAQRVATPGALGPIYLQSIRDLAALLLALLLVIGWAIWSSHGQRVIIAATATFVRSRPQKKEASAQQPAWQPLALFRRLAGLLWRLRPSFTHATTDEQRR